MFALADTRKLQTALLDPRAMNSKPITIRIDSDQVSGRQNQLVWNVHGHPANVSKQDRQEQTKVNEQQKEGGFGLNRFALSSAIVLSSAVCLWILLFLLIGAFYFNVTSTATAFKQELRPQLEQALQRMGSVLDHMDKAATSADHMIAEADSLEHSIVPAVVHAVNDSAAVLHKLESIARNPVFKLSLG